MSKNVVMMLLLGAAAIGVPSLASALSPNPRPILTENGSTLPVMPEPSAAALFGLGAALVAARSRKRR
jgi:PEP-CTERM motif